MVIILLLNDMEVFSVGGGSLLDRPCMYRLCFCMSEVISSFKSLRTGHKCLLSLCCFFL